MRTAQAIPWISRADLQSVEFDSATAKYYSVKDPIRDEYYAFDPATFFILSKLKTPQTLQSLIQFCAAELGQRIGVSEIQNYIRRLANDNLIVPHVFGDGDRLMRQRHLEQRAWWLQQILALLSIRVWGTYPGELLRMLSPVGWLCFNPVSVALFIIGVITTLVFAGLSWETLGSLVPALSDLTDPGIVVAVLVGFCVAKIAHELSHALACQYQGREVSEMGLLLLVFLPCMYCDVSDMWTHRRTNRLFVTLAGVWAELGIAVVCFWLWYLTVPGPLHTCCYSLMLITSINTFLLNGNPLMRYDGYYALSDLVGIPNLAAVARQQFRQRIGSFFWRREPEVRQPGLLDYLWLYEALSRCYRGLVLGLICLGIWKFFDAQELTSLGRVAVASVLMLAIIPMIGASVQSARAGLRRKNRGGGGLRWMNLVVLVGLGLVLIYLACGVEFSHRIWGIAQFQLADPQHVFAPLEGKFIARIKDGQHVSANELLATIENPELELEQTILSGQLAETRLNLDLNRLKTDAVSLAAETEFWSLREKTLLRRLDENRTKRNRLEIHAPCAGKFVATEFNPDSSDPNELTKYVGTLLDPENQDAEVDRGDPIGYVGNPAKRRGILNVDQKDIELIEIGQQVKVAVAFDSVPRLATVTEIALAKAESSTAIDAKANSDSKQVAYQVVIELENGPEVRVGSQYPALVLCRKTNLISFVGRWLRNSFWF
jgi:putative peptide zinc metalloprotease protein